MKAPNIIEQLCFVILLEIMEQHRQRIGLAGRRARAGGNIFIQRKYVLQ